MLSTPIPDGLCPNHGELFRRYRENHYSPQKPSEWPGRSPLIDSRVTHAERSRDWDLKNTRVMNSIVEACGSGASVGCLLDRPPVTATPALPNSLRTGDQVDLDGAARTVDRVVDRCSWVHVYMTGDPDPYPVPAHERLLVWS